MVRFVMQCAAMALVGGICASPSFVQAATAKEQAVRQESPRSVLLLDKGWQLYAMPDFQAWPAEQLLTAAQIRQLTLPAQGKGWQPVRLPDDYLVRGAFSPEPNPSILAGGAVCALGKQECEVPKGSPSEERPKALNRPGRNAFGGHGYLPAYPAWYQRNVFIPGSAKGKDVWLDFGGVYRDAVVFVNGQFIDQHASGYTSFRLNITSAVQYEKQNSIAVFVDPRWFEGWWYEGGGIYRQVRLMISDPLQVSPWGTFVDAQVPGAIHSGSPAGDRAAAQLTIQTTVRNNHAASRAFTLVSQVIDPAGKVAASSSSEEELAAGQEATFSQRMALPDALLWSLEHRNLYTLATTLRVGRAAVDEEQTTFGVRTIRFDPERGFFLNGKHVEIQGMCVHQDFPGVGIAGPDNLWQWQIEKLQAMGTNAYRTAHNPAAEAFYDAADRMGMLVMAENRHLGDTYTLKASGDTPYSDLSDLKAMVLQLRNHPSIIMWSLGNEEGQQATPYGAKIFAAMKEAVKKIDPTRPSTSAMNGGFTPDGFISVEDLLGMNYHNGEFAKIHRQYPGLMIYGSEDSNAKTARGTYESSRPSGLCSGYGCDSFTAGPWNSWVPVVENSFVAGQFVWTGFDYRGEPNPFSWPAVTSQTGIMDLAGFPKPDYYYWKAAWNQTPQVHIFPDWSFPKEAVGKSILVRVFSNCDRVELLLNGKSVGVQSVGKELHLDWQVPYAPGTLTAIGYRQGREAARYTVHTAGVPAALRLTPEVGHLAANGEDIAPVEIEIVDAEGRVVPDADNQIEFTVSGAGTLAGVANGNPASHEPNFATQRQGFHGLAMVLVRAADRPGAITIQARAQGLMGAKIVISTVADKPNPRTR
jgi:beta-galactosidase